MKVINIHRRIIKQPKEQIAALFSTLATKEDKIWPKEQWPPMIFKEGLAPGNAGRHGPIKYSVDKIITDELIQFRFTSPKGFDGVHRLEIAATEAAHTEIKHTIDMRTKGKATLIWLFAIRWLHDALLEDAFDKVENYFSKKEKRTKWNVWVRFLRKVLK